jgi:hypothetical protein
MLALPESGTFATDIPVKVQGAKMFKDNILVTVEW